VRHSIVAWDSSFRNAFHLLRSLAETDYDRDEVELIFVEQRAKAVADEVATTHGVASVEQVADDVGDRLRVEICYLDQRDDRPYHPGRLINAGLALASGTVVSTMDADVLVPADFFRALDDAHAKGNRVATMDRVEASKPCGVPVSDWTHQIIDYDRVLAICPRAKLPIPETVTNKAPLLSARREHWRAIGGYDAHRIFSTGYTLFGVDVSTRFGLLLGPVERGLPIRCVHPWHPTNMRRGEEIFRCLFEVQRRAIGWSRRMRSFDVRERAAISDALFEEHRTALEDAIAVAERSMREGARSTPG